MSLISTDSRSGKGGNNSLTVRARQKLGTPEDCEAFTEDLQQKLVPDDSEATSVIFEDFDISQNKIPFDQWETIFSMLADHQAHVLRLRSFGCATLDDNALQAITTWLSQCTEENAPYEMHLSDCAITTEGFNALMETIEASDAFPPMIPRIQQKKPLYMRIENNYIAEEAIQAKVDAGIICTVNKINDTPKGIDEAKIKLLVKRWGQYQQNEGTPPDPDDAPAPKPVAEFGKKHDDWGKGKGGKGSGQQKGSWGSGQQKGSWGNKPSWGNESWGSKPAWSEPAKPQAASWTPRPFAPLAGKGSGKGKGDGKSALALGGGGYNAKGGQKGNVAQNNAMGGRPGFQAQAGGKAKGKAASGPAVAARGSAGTAGQRNDRSRTPAPPAKGPGGKGPPLPAPWEEHWSEEYGIPYFWNSKTGDAAWERPTK